MKLNFDKSHIVFVLVETRCLEINDKFIKTMFSENIIQHCLFHNECMWTVLYKQTLSHVTLLSSSVGHDNSSNLINLLEVTIRY